MVETLIMAESPEASRWQRFQGRTTGFVLLLAFLLRLWKASGTFLNLDEAMHFLAANKPSLAEAYRSSLNLAHPPLLILLLNVWRRLGTSELLLRLPSVVAGTIFCWIFFRWLTRILGLSVGWVGFVLVSLLPVFVELSAEIRQYPLLLCFMMAAAYVLELALDDDSAGEMAWFFFFLYLAMLTHFSAMLFAGAVGVYSLWRMVSDRPSRRVISTWVVGQSGALGLLVFLCIEQIAKLSGGTSAQHMRVLLANSYFQRGHDHLFGFVFARTFGIFQYTFGQLAVGDIAGVLFIWGIVLLMREKITIKQSRPSLQQLGLLLILPFAINAATAIFDIYPYGGTRHSAFLVPFAVAGVSLAIVQLARRQTIALGVALLLVALCQVFGAPHRPYMRREDQRRSNMMEAMDTIRQNVSADDVIFADFQTNFVLRFYLCPEVGPSDSPASEFRTYSCSGHRVISTNSETSILTANLFPRRWNEMVATFGLKPDQTVWVFQAGWDIDLARELQGKFPEFHDLKSQSFGRNITLFKLNVGSGRLGL
jgi:Dolichyl-phosphate-mannose-protein mannosyltransferase